MEGHPGHFAGMLDSRQRSPEGPGLGRSTSQQRSLSVLQQVAECSPCASIIFAARLDRWKARGDAIANRL